MAKALKTVRKARGLSQEAFSDVSTYMSTLERDLKIPMLHKLREVMANPLAIGTEIADEKPVPVAP